MNNILKMSLYYSPGYKIPTYSSPIYSPVMSPYSPVISPYSPVTPVVTPVSKVNVGPYSTTITTSNVLSYVPNQLPVYLQYGQYNDLNNGYVAQQQMVEYMLDLVLEKWIYKDLCYLLKYLKITNERVDFIDSIEEYKDNKICNDIVEDVELKAKFIKKYVFGKEEMRKLLKRMIEELGYNWTEFPLRKGTVMEAVERYIKRSLREEVSRREKK